MSTLKSKMGLRRSRRRGREKVTLAVFMAATALNVLRMPRWLHRKVEKAFIAASSTPRLLIVCFLCYALAVFGEVFKARCFALVFERWLEFSGV